MINDRRWRVAGRHRVRAPRADRIRCPGRSASRGLDPASCRPAGDRAPAARPAHPRRAALADRGSVRLGVPAAGRAGLPRPVHEPARRRMGYGDAYAQANVGDWGGIDARDLLAAVDAACARPDVDPDRRGRDRRELRRVHDELADRHDGPVPGRRRAELHQRHAQRVPHDRRSDRHSTGTWAGRRGSTPERYQRLSPLTHVEQIRTPLLLIHSEPDQNCPISQSEQLYTALRLLGREVEFLRLPGEGHLVNLVGRPSQPARPDRGDRPVPRPSPGALISQDRASRRRHPPSTGRLGQAVRRLRRSNPRGACR